MELKFSKTILLLLGISLWLYWLWTRRSFYRIALKMPGYFGLPIIGVFLRIMHPKRELYRFNYSKSSKQTKNRILPNVYIFRQAY